jgi:hypothetical protein
MILAVQESSGGKNELKVANGVTIKAFQIWEET